MPQYEIPSEFQDRLGLISDPDERSDQEIFHSLASHVPVTSEKNIWAFWDGGINQLPSWCRRNVIDWVRICGPSWTVRILDNIPESPNYALHFAPQIMLARCFVERTMTGRHAGQHASDLITGALLYTHGGVKMDVGCILMRDLDRGLWSQLEDPQSPYEVAAPIQYAQFLANHFVAARKGNPFIKRWHELFTYLWKDRHSSRGISPEPIMAFLKQAFSLSESKSRGFKWNFKVSMDELIDYVAQNGCWARLCMLEDTDDDPFNASKYWQTHVLAIDVLKEHWAAKTLVGAEDFGRHLTDLLSIQVDSNPTSETYNEAYSLVWTLLASTSMQKISRGSGLVHTLQPGSVWDEKPGVECQPGSFGELLRYGAVHFKQIRQYPSMHLTEKSSIVLKKGLVEA